MNRVSLLLLIAVLNQCLHAFGADEKDSFPDERNRFESRVFKYSKDKKLFYRILKPKDYDTSKRYPLVLFFHGAGERGDDNKKQLVHGMRDFASDKKLCREITG